MKILLAALGLVGFLLLSLLALTSLRQYLQPPPVVPTAAGLEDLRVELESALLRSGVSLAQIQQRQQNGITVFDVANEFPPPEVLHRLTERLRGRLPAVAIDTEIRPSSLLVYLNGQVVYSLRFSPPAPEQPGPAALGGPVVTPVEKGKLAIIMDDLGQDMTTARRVLAIDLPVTFAIIPTNERAFEVATLAHEQGREVLIHIPMEPKGYPAINPGEDALLVRLSAAEIRRRLISFRRRVPYAVGGNNHMGSAFTEDRQQMSLVMQELRDAGMFFVDSRTSSRSLAVEIARATGVPTASRDVFLDNVQQVDSIARELHRLVRLALRHGQAVGICHPYPQTLKALQREADYIRSQGVQVVFASQLVTLR